MRKFWYVNNKISIGGIGPYGIGKTMVFEVMKPIKMFEEHHYIVFLIHLVFVHLCQRNTMYLFRCSFLK